MISAMSISFGSTTTLFSRRSSSQARTYVAASSRLRPWSSGLTVTLLCCSLAACGLTSASDQEPAPGAPTIAAPTQLNPSQPFGGQPAVWFNKDLQPASRVANINGVAVVQVHDGPKLFLRGFKPTDGEMLWSRPLKSSVLESESDEPASLDNRTVIITEWAADPRKGATLILIDPAARGAEVGRTQLHRFVDTPKVCADDATYVCARVLSKASQEAKPPSGLTTDELRTWRILQQSEQANKAQHVRFKPGMKDVQARPETSVTINKQKWEPANKEGLAFGYDNTTRVIGRIDGNSVRWKKTEAELFGKDYSTHPSSWFYLRQSDLFYGEIDNAPVHTSRDSATPLPKTSAVLAVKGSTGEVAWRVDGATTACQNDLSADPQSPQNPLFLCVWTAGTLRLPAHDLAQQDLPPAQWYAEPELALVRLDPNTGQRAWTTSLGVLAKKITDLYPLFSLVQPVGDNAVLLTRSAHGPVVVHLTDGSLRKTGPDDISWTRETVEHGDHLPGTTAPNIDDDKAEYPHGDVDQPMIAGNPSLTITTPLPGTVGAQFDGVRVVATKRGILAYASPNPAA